VVVEEVEKGFSQLTRTLNQFLQWRRWEKVLKTADEKRMVWRRWCVLVWVWVVSM